MGNIVIPEAEFEPFLRNLFAKVTKTQEELIAEFNARLTAKEAIVNAQFKAAHERKLKAAEEQIERKICAVEEEIARRKRAAEDEIECKRRAAEEEIERKARAADEEIERLRQLERLRITYEAERDEGSQLQ